MARTLLNKTYRGKLPVKLDTKDCLTGTRTAGPLLKME